MLDIGSSTQGLPEEVQSIPGPRVQRQVLLRPSYPCEQSLPTTTSDLPGDWKFWAARLWCCGAAIVALFRLQSKEGDEGEGSAGIC